MRDVLLELLQEYPDIAPGVSGDQFHVQQAGTHAAAVDRLRDTGGYEINIAAEGGPLLCPTWPTASTWNQTSHINLKRFLDSAYGGAVPWETLFDRED